MQEPEETPYLRPSTQDQMYTSTLTFIVPALLGATYHRYYVRFPPSTSSEHGWGVLPSLCSSRCKYFVKF